MRGSSVRSGRPPDPDALRRDRPADQAGWTTLPDRRDGPCPPWPLPEASDREAELWARQWVRPQAVMWERNGQQEEVAHYVRALGQAERDGAGVAIRTLVVRMQETLGLSIPGMARNRWRIGGQAPAPVREDDTDRTSARARLQAIEGGRTPS